MPKMSGLASYVGFMAQFASHAAVLTQDAELDRKRVNKSKENIVKAIATGAAGKAGMKQAAE